MNDLSVTYFAADLTDPALVRRVQMLQTGGASVNILGFRRSVDPVPEVAGICTIDLGQTFDNRLGNRFMQVLRRSAESWKWRKMIKDSDVLLARNLEMATIADAARTWANSEVRLIYECLDINPIQLGNGISSKIIRSWERKILRRSDAMIVSSPVHLNNYFTKLDIELPDVIMAENKRVLRNIIRPSYEFRRRRPGHRPPWRIGWFGLLRCVESFRLLMELALRNPNLIDITLRGRPTQEVQNLIDQHLPIANMRFGGSYIQSELEEMYGECDFTWAIEYFGNSKNAKWALGNRLYEGNFYNCPVIALTRTAMGEWLQSRGAGITFSYNNFVSFELETFFTKLTIMQYDALLQATVAIPSNDLVWTPADCQLLVKRMAGIHTFRNKLETKLSVAEWFG